jgi:hypothetical protein
MGNVTLINGNDLLHNKSFGTVHRTAEFILHKVYTELNVTVPMDYTVAELGTSATSSGNSLFPT